MLPVFLLDSLSEASPRYRSLALCLPVYRMGIGWEVGEKGKETGASAEVLGLYETFTHLFSHDHGNMESPVINRVPNGQWLNQR